MSDTTEWTVAPWTVRHDVPALDHDKMMAERFGSEISPRMRIERRVVFNLCEYLLANGFELLQVYDGDEFTKVKTSKEAMELIFNLDEASLRVRKAGRRPDGKRWPEHGILIVLGNDGWDAVADYNYSRDDADHFNAIMEVFDGEACV